MTEELNHARAYIARLEARVHELSSILDGDAPLKVVINRCYGGFRVSEEAADMIGLPAMICDYMSRHDHRLVAAVETLGSERASGECSRLVVEEVRPSLYQIDSYDGMESLR